MYVYSLYTDISYNKHKVTNSDILKVQLLVRTSLSLNQGFNNIINTPIISLTERHFLVTKTLQYLMWLLTSLELVETRNQGSG